MRLQEFTTAEEQIYLLKFISDNFYNIRDLKNFAQEQKHAFDQQKQKKMSKTSQPRSSKPKQPNLAKQPIPKVVSTPSSKSVKSPLQQNNHEKESKNTSRSKPQTVSPPSCSDASVGAQNALKTRSQKRVPHDPNSVASIQRQLDPLAFDPIVKKLTR